MRRLYGMMASLATLTILMLPVRGQETQTPATPATDDILQQPNARRLEDGTVQIGRINIDPKQRTLSFPAVVNLDQGVLEVVIATPEGRLHEALFKADISPLNLQALLYLLELRNGPRQRDLAGRRGDIVDIDVEYRSAEGKTVREPIENWIRDTRTGGTMERIGWVFTGSTMKDGRFLATVEGNICINFSAGSTILDSPDPESTDDTIHVIDGTRDEPAAGSDVRIIVVPRKTRQ